MTRFLQGRGALQDIDQMCLFKPLCKFTATITRIADIVPTVREALQAAQSGTPGTYYYASMGGDDELYDDILVDEHPYCKKILLS